MMIDGQTYNGWTNRETWATYLWLTNEEGLYQEAIEMVRAPFKGEGRYALGPFDHEAIPLLEDDIANMFDGLFDFDNMTRDLYRMREDIGSLWRVDWRSIVEHLIDDSVEWQDNDYDGDETPLAMAMEDN
jgi:hypothetical protein